MLYRDAYSRGESHVVERPRLLRVYYAAHYAAVCYITLCRSKNEPSLPRHLDETSPPRYPNPRDQPSYVIAV